MTNLESKSYFPGYKPETANIKEVVSTMGRKCLTSRGEEFQRLRETDLDIVIRASPYLTEIFQKNPGEAYYKAIRAVRYGPPTDDPEANLSEKREAIETVRQNLRQRYWQVYDQNSAERYYQERCDQNPKALARLTKEASKLPLKRQKLLELMIQTEQYGFVGYQQVIDQLAQDRPFNFLAYCCLPNVPNEQRISDNIWESYFFRLWERRKFRRFYKDLREASLLDEIKLTLLIVDSEPWNAWGWNPQNQPANDLIISDLVVEAEKILLQDLGPTVEVTRYSSFFPKQEAIKRQLSGSIEIPARLLEEEKALYLALGIPITNLEETAYQSALNYIAEGVELLGKPPVTIIGIETPIRQRDTLWQLGRNGNFQSVFHPLVFKEEEY